MTRYGIPLAVYADTHTTYQAPAPPTGDEQWAGVKPTSQLGRARGELGVELIPAHSPPAKGRGERLFNTVQDRGIKGEAARGRLHAGRGEPVPDGLSADLQSARRRSACAGRRSASPRPTPRELSRILCIKTTQGLRRDWTVAHHGQLYQVRSHVRATHVLGEAHVDGTMRITHQGRTRSVPAITSRPMKAAEAKKVHRPRYPVPPRPDHPWRTRPLPTRDTHAAAAIT